jgi:hypothetical protein
MSTHGVHAGCIEDMWQVAIEMAERAGGDRGCPGLFEPSHAPAAYKPERLIVLDTAGWEGVDAASKSAFETPLGKLERAGVRLLRSHFASTGRKARGRHCQRCSDLQCDHGMGEPVVAEQPC